MTTDPLFVPVRVRMEALREDASTRTPSRPPRPPRPPGRVRRWLARELVRLARRVEGRPVSSATPRS